MKEDQELIITEKAELDDKIGKLHSFMISDKSAGLSDDERIRMIRQRITMSEYSRILGERIKVFT